MRASEEPELNLQPTLPTRAAPNISRKKKRRKRSSITSRYFPKSALKNSCRFASSLFPNTNNPSLNENRKDETQKRASDTDALPKATPKTNSVENEVDENVGYSLFTMKKTIPRMNAKEVVSNYFLRSPASAQESIQSLGPLVYTWIGSSSCKDIRSNCLLHTSSSTINRKPCNPCWKTLTEDGFRHFLDCPIFRLELDVYTVNSEFARFQPPGCKTTCVELVGRWAEEHALRHLCSNQCFHRAFAPSREWMILRKKLTKFRPIGNVLNDWTCRLVHETETDNDEISKSSSPFLSHYVIGDEEKNFEQVSTTLFERNIPQTIFLSLKTGEVWKLVIVDLF